MVSDSDMGTEEREPAEEEEEGRESESMGGMQASEGETGVTGREMEAESAAPSAAKPKAKGGGRRAALRILRENVDNVSKDLASFRKNHEANSKRLEKQVASLRSEVTSLKSFISKENARAKGKQEALLNRIITKMNEKKPKAPAAPKPKKKSPPKKTAKGKK